LIKEPGPGTGEFVDDYHCSTSASCRVSSVGMTLRGSVTAVVLGWLDLLAVQHVEVVRRWLIPAG